MLYLVCKTYFIDKYAFPSELELGSHILRVQVGETWQLDIRLIGWSSYDEPQCVWSGWPVPLTQRPALTGQGRACWGTNPAPWSGIVCLRKLQGGWLTTKHIKRNQNSLRAYVCVTPPAFWHSTVSPSLWSARLCLAHTPSCSMSVSRMWPMVR